MSVGTEQRYPAGMATASERPQDVASHFDRVATWFDSVYTGDGVKPAMRAINRIFLHDIHWRLQLALRDAEPIRGSSVLDIGCGSAVFLEELGRRGATRLVGLDFAPSMIDIARKRIDAAGLSGVTELRCVDFLAEPGTEQFDTTLAVGVFDYFRDPTSHLVAMRAVTRRRAITTFPQLWNPWTAVRRTRYTLTGINCPLHFFSRRHVREMHHRAGFRTVRIKRLTNIFYVVAEP